MKKIKGIQIGIEVQLPLFEEGIIIYVENMMESNKAHRTNK